MATNVGNTIDVANRTNVDTRPDISADVVQRVNVDNVSRANEISRESVSRSSEVPRVSADSVVDTSSSQQARESGYSQQQGQWQSNARESSGSRFMDLMNVRNVGEMATKGRPERPHVMNSRELSEVPYGDALSPMSSYSPDGSVSEMARLAGGGSGAVTGKNVMTTPSSHMTMPEGLASIPVLSTGRQVASQSSPSPVTRPTDTVGLVSPADSVETSGEVEESGMTGRPDSIWNRDFRYDPKNRKPTTRMASTRRLLGSEHLRSLKNGFKNAFNKKGRGYRCYGKMIGLTTLDLREVGLGMQEIVAAVEQNPEMIERLLKPFLLPGQSVGAMSAQQVADLINRHDVYVATFKPPNNRGQDIQRRKLHILTQEQRGIYIHPTMAALYTADFDGDDMEVSFDPEVAKYAKDPMDHMIGIDGSMSLDMKFLPVSNIVDGWDPEHPNKTAYDYVREVMLGAFSDYTYDEIGSLIKAILELAKTYNLGEDKQKEAYEDVFREARRLSDAKYPSSKDASDALMSRLCKAVYQGMQNIRVKDALMTIDGSYMFSSVTDGLPETRTYDDLAVYKVLDGIVQGAVPNNFQELKLMLSGFVGNAEGKNAPFRFSADVGKVLKMDSRFQVGDGYFEIDPDNREQMQGFFQTTLKFAESRCMAVSIKEAGREQYYSQLLRDSVIKDVGFPDSGYESFSEFLLAFCESYNRHSAVINQAQLVFMTNNGISSSSDRGMTRMLSSGPSGYSLSDIAEPFLTIYGQYSVGRMFSALRGKMSEGVVDPFWKENVSSGRKRHRSYEYEFDHRADSPEFWITGKYLDYNLRAFVHENRLLRGDNMGSYHVGGKSDNVTNRTVGGLSAESDIEGQFLLLLTLADKRTGTASKYNQSYYGITNDGKRAPLADGSLTSIEMQAKLLSELNRLDEDGATSRDQMLLVEDVIRALVASDPDMFYYFGMDSVAGFLQSKWGKALAENANDLEVLGGIKTAMVFEYRMERVIDLESKLSEAVGSDIGIEDAYNNLQFAKAELSAASEVWRGIIKEFDADGTPGMESAFSAFVAGRRPTHVTAAGERYVWGPSDLKLDAARFWANPGDHDSLRSVIEDIELDRDTKWSVIADIVRYWEHDLYLKSWEVGFQMEVGNDTTYSLGAQPSGRVLKKYRDFQGAFNRWGRMSQESMQKDIDEASEMFSSRPGFLLATLSRLDSSPWELVSIDDHMYADSILAVKAKVYAQTEKASQHPWSNAIYEALSSQRNGGYMNDVTRTDDRLLGIMSADSIGIDDVIHILADPDAMIYAYNQFGEIGVLTRDNLIEQALGRPLNDGDVESDIWEFLKKEPRIASAIRRHSACVKADADGTGYVGASLSISETIGRSNSSGYDVQGHVKYLMRDHPGYAGIISLLSPSRRTGRKDALGREVTVGSVTRNERERIVEIEDAVCDELYFWAFSQEQDAASNFLDGVGITQDALTAALKSDYDSFLEQLGLAKPGTPEESRIEAAEDAATTYEIIHGHVENYLQEIRENVRHAEGESRRASARRVVPRTGRAITSFRGKYSFLSNFYTTNVTIDGLTYRNAEAAFQAQKCADPSDRERFTRLSGKQARDLGRRVPIRDDWDFVKEDVMRDVISAKFSNPRLREMLDSTSGMELIEGNYWGDSEWGVSNGRGRNLLGRILMDERNDLESFSFQGIDAVSMASYWDVLQDLGGSKTQRSTGVEGRETWLYGMWASHMKARDGYADLQSVTDDIDSSWDGMWTSLQMSETDSSPVILSVNDDGEFSLSAYVIGRDGKEELRTFVGRQGLSELKGLRNMPDSEEIVTSVPEGYVVKDRSIDSSGNQVASLFAYMVSKRSNGAEAFNLKAKKAGLDKLDSITKMQGKHLTEPDPSDHGKQRRVDFIERRETLRKAYAFGGINAARMQLAQMMLESNRGLGYEDLTLSNYMSIAEIMLMEAQGEDGSTQLYLRSLEMLFSAIKYRIGARIDEMTDEEMTAEADRIVNDTSTESGVGIATTDSLSLLDGIRPKSKASSFSAIRTNSSVFQRNYDLLSEIEHDTGMTPPMDQGELSRSDKAIRETDGIKGLIDRVSLLRNYKAVGYVGGSNGRQSIRFNIGPQSLFLIGDGDIIDNVDDVFDEAWRYGMTIVVSGSNRDLIPDWMRHDMMPCSDAGDVIIPCFDMRLNGSEADAYNGGRFAIFQAPFSSYNVTVEDSLNVHELGDAQCAATRNYADRISVSDSGTETMTVEQLFPNVFRNPEFRNSLFKMSMVSDREIRNLIVTNGVRCTIDYSVVEGGRGFEQRVRDVDSAIDRYCSRFQQANADGVMMGDDVECGPGDIVAWAQLEITDSITRQVQYCLSPIIPFNLHGTKSSPETFSVDQVGPLGYGNDMIEVCWSTERPIVGSFAKYFDSSGGANKGMVNFSKLIEDDFTLMDGTPVDIYVAKASTDSRKIGTDRRIKTMISLMALARMHGYNFATADGAFPTDSADHPENQGLKDALMHGRVSAGDWAQLLNEQGSVLFTYDEKLNAFLNWECKKILMDGGNPTDYLANCTVDDEGNLDPSTNTHVMWEFEAMFDQGVNYEDSLLHFLHSMDSRLCPDGIDDMGENYMFRLYRDADGDAKGYDNGVLQMRVPHRADDGRISYNMWDNVYIGLSFFGQDFSGFSRPNVDGSSNMLDGMNTMAMYGNVLDKISQRLRASWATYDIGRIPRDGGAIGKA